LEMHKSNPFRELNTKTDSAMALRVTDLVSDGLSREIQQPICNEMTEDLTPYEKANTGRVALADFYRATFDARFFYVETRDYLREVGAIDETDTNMGPKVIIPNYVQLPGNCIGQDHVYSICCKSECEDLFGALERKLQTPAASVDQILSVISSLSSSTVQAPRNLSQQLVSRLSDLSNIQGGDVILHSRLFSQWMHSAFPHECPYPHQAGAKSALSISVAVWEETYDRSSRVDDEGTASREDKLTRAIEELNKEFSAMPEVDNASVEVDAMWTDDDRHFVEPSSTYGIPVLGLPCLLGVAIVGLIAAKKEAPKKSVSADFMPPTSEVSAAGSYFV